MKNPRKYYSMTKLEQLRLELTGLGFSKRETRELKIKLAEEIRWERAFGPEIIEGCYPTSEEISEYWNVMQREHLEIQAKEEKAFGDMVSALGTGHSVSDDSEKIH